MSIYFGNHDSARTEAAGLAARIKARFGIEVVNGFEQPVCEDFCQKEEYQIASFKNIRKAWKISRRNNERFSFLSAALPEILTTEKTVIIFCIGMGYGAAYPQPSGYFSFLINGEHAIDIHEAKYSKSWENGGFSLYYDVMRYETAPKGCSLSLDPYISAERMASFGICYLTIPSSKLKCGQKIRIDVIPFGYFPSDAWIRIDQPCETGSMPYVLACLDIEHGLIALQEGRKPAVINGFNAYSGDIHSHSFCGAVSPCDNREEKERRNCTGCRLLDGDSTGCGHGTVTRNYYFAQHVACLDFYCLTDHDFQLSDEDWTSRLGISDDKNEDGRFTVINGYEYTSWMYGHRNVYFRSAPSSIFRAVPYKESYGSYLEKPVSDMFRFYTDRKVDFISIPHHPTAADHCFSWDSYDGEHEKMVEVFSGWGNSESEDGPLPGNGSNKIKGFSAGIQLYNGKQFGFTAGSDSHDGFPGLSQGSGIYNFANKFTETSSGKTIALCKNLDRAAVFDALHSCRAYATTGAPIYVEFFVNDGFMGDRITAKKHREISVDVRAPAEISKIQIVKNGRTIHRQWCDCKNEHLVYVDTGSEHRTDCYYVRVILADREMAWVSPIWVSEQ